MYVWVANNRQDLNFLQQPNSRRWHFFECQRLFTLVNVSLLTAWILPVTTPIIAACFIGPAMSVRNADSIAIQPSKSSSSDEKGMNDGQAPA